jgi:dTDP-glucose 4,6-dehydratase
MRVLVTGTAGFILGNFLRRACFTKQKYEFVSVDRVKKGSVMGDVYRHGSHTFYIANVIDAHTMNIIFETGFRDGPPEIVVHGCAETHVDNSIADNTPFVLSNVLGTQVILDCCVKWKTRKLVYISTDEVYGHLTSEDEPSWNEETPTAPRNPYSASKLAGEMLIKAAHETHGLTYNVTRSCNNYGPWQDPSKFIPKIIKSMTVATPSPKSSMMARTMRYTTSRPVKSFPTWKSSSSFATPWARDMT